MPKPTVKRQSYCYGEKGWLQDMFPGVTMKEYRKKDPQFKEIASLVSNFTDFNLSNLFKLTAYSRKYMATVHGGENGSGIWTNYLDQLHTLFSMISPDTVSTVELVDMAVDSVDDVFSFVMEFDYDFKKQ